MPVGIIIRLGILLLTRRWGLIVLGAILVIVGVVYGASSHAGTYQTINGGGKFEFYALQSGKDYIQFANDPNTLYVIYQSDVSPSFDGVAFLNNNNLTFQSLVHQSDSNAVDIQLTNGPEYTRAKICWAYCTFCARSCALPSIITLSQARPMIYYAYGQF